MVNPSLALCVCAQAQLAASLVKDAVDSYIKAADPGAYEAVIAACEREGKFEDAGA